MTIDEAIAHAEEVAEENYGKATAYLSDREVYKYEEQKCLKCADEHRQLAEWLKELKVYKERMPSYEAGYNDAKREIALSGEYERAYERGKADAQTEGWIPVSERLPEDGQEVQITYDAKRKTEKYRVWSAIWDELHGRFYDKEYRSYISLDYVTAWMPLPEPYKEESEGESE